MVAGHLLLETSTVHNHLYVRVPWDKADSLRSRLQEQGIQAIACFDAAERAAGLEILSPVDAETLRHILNSPQG